MLFSYTAIHPTTGNTGNQKPQPPKHHHHTTTTTTKIKITQKTHFRTCQTNISSLNSKTQIKPRKIINHNPVTERRRKRGRTIGFGVEDDWFWGATIAIGDDESGFAIGDDESMLRLRSRSARRRSRRAKSNGEVNGRSRRAKSNGEVERRSRRAKSKARWRSARRCGDQTRCCDDRVVLSLSFSLSFSLARLLSLCLSPSFSLARRSFSRSFSLALVLCFLFFLSLSLRFARHGNELK